MVKVFIDVSEMDQWRHEKCLQIQKEMEIIYNSNMFKELFMAMKPVGELSEWRHEERLPELFNYLMSGATRLQPNQDNVINFYLDDYYKRFSSTVGYTYPDVNKIWVNTKYFDSFSNKYAGSNLAHEMMHKLGCDHDFNSTARRPYSIPYLMNDIYEKCHDILITGASDSDPECEWVKVCYRPWYRFGFKKCYWVKK